MSAADPTRPSAGALSPFPAAGPPRYQLLRGVQAGLIRRFDATLEDPRAAQEARWQAIRASAVDTEFGRAHGLARARTLEDLRAAVPVRTHDGLRPYLDRVADGARGVLTTAPVTQLLETSGTTGAPKLLPVTRAWAAGVAEAQALWVLGLLGEHPDVALGPALTVVSPAAHRTSTGGLPVGSNTGRMHLAQPWWVRSRYPVPYEVFCIGDEALRQYVILRFALGAGLRSLTTANPSTILLLARRLREWQAPLTADLRAGTLREGPAAALAASDRRRWEPLLRAQAPPEDWSVAALWRLAVLNCWTGGPAAYFAARLPAALGAPIPVREVGVTASEGYFAIPVGRRHVGCALWLQGHVLEFIGDDGAPRWAWELEPGEQVRLVCTTEAGLFRYDLQDTLEVTGRIGRLPLVRFVGKTGRWLNATGEKVSEAQVSAALAAAVGEGAAPTGFCARTHWDEVPAVVLAVEGPAPPGLAPRFDVALAALNPEYAGKRASGRLGEARVEVLPGGTFARFRSARVAAGAPDGQVKDPVIARDAAEWARVRDAAGLPPEASA
jgi:hypothetical protein